MKANKQLTAAATDLTRLGTDATVAIGAEPAVRERFAALPDFMQERYSVRRIVGFGGFGIVYLALDRKFGRWVAIKRLFDDRIRDRGVYDRFIQEAKIAGRLEHPNIVIVYSIEEDVGNVCMAMEYLGGGSLQDIMTRNPMMKLKTAIHIMLGILTGLEAAHGIGVVHRDIKPQNILFGVGNVPKITDFGVAHLPGLEDGGEDEEEREPLVGSPAYMSPEQLFRERVDARADLYSAGVVFHEMLAGHKLFPWDSGDSLRSIRERVMHVQPDSLGELRGDIPPAVEKVVMALLEKSPENRYPDAFTARRDLARALGAIGVDSKDLEEGFHSTSISSFLNSPATILEDVIYLLLLDGQMTDRKREEIAQRTERLGMNEDQALLIEQKVRRRLKLPGIDA